MILEKLDKGLIMLSCQSRLDDAILVRDIEWFVRDSQSAGALQEILNGHINVARHDNRYPRTVKLLCYCTTDTIIGVSGASTNEAVSELSTRLMGLHDQVPSPRMIMDVLNITDTASDRLKKDIAALQTLYAKYNSVEHLGSLRKLIYCYTQAGFVSENSVINHEALYADGLLTTVSTHKGPSAAVTELGGELAFLAMYCSHVVVRSKRLVSPPCKEGE